MAAVDLLRSILVLNLAGAAAIAVVLLARKPVRSRFGARIAYGLWLLVPLAVAGSLLPARTVIIEPAPSLVVAQFPALSASAIQPFAWPVLLLALWVMGAAASLWLLLLRQRRSVALLGRTRPILGDDRLWRASRPAVGPAVIGLASPRIILPSDFEDRFAPEEQAVVLAHESAHLAAGDVWINAAAAIALCLCWFNPLAHLAVRRLRTDQELACDAAVLARFPGLRRSYAEALLKTQSAPAQLPLGCYWPAPSISPLKERIAMLKQDLPATPLRLAGAALVGALSLSGGLAAWAAQPPRPVLAQTDASRPAALLVAQAPAPKADAAPRVQFEDEWRVLNDPALREHLEQVGKELERTVADPVFQARMKDVAAEMERLTADPALRDQMARLGEELGRFAHDPALEQQMEALGKQFDQLALRFDHDFQDLAQRHEGLSPEARRQLEQTLEQARAAGEQAREAARQARQDMPRMRQDMEEARERSRQAVAEARARISERESLTEAARLRRLESERARIDAEIARLRERQQRAD